MKADPLWSVFIAFVAFFQAIWTADIVIQIPQSSSLFGQDGAYRLYYRPPVGIPLSNYTFRPEEVAHRLEISNALPGTEYYFWLYFTNVTFTDLPVWTANILTVPDPPTNLSVNARMGKSIQISWDPPAVGGHTGFMLKVIPITEAPATIRNMHLEATSTSFSVDDLTPGSTYELKLFSIFKSKESALHISTNVTTRPNNPGRFIVWFRNETTLLVLWQPPYPPGYFSHYKVSIEPMDAQESVLYVEKERDPPGPAQAAFNGLVPGKAYNISVQTSSEDQVSLPTTAQYRTVPLPPRNVTLVSNSLKTNSFEIRWEAPLASSEFDRYQVSLGIRKMTPIIVNRFEERVATFTEDLEPGKTYEVVVKTVSGNVFSWPTAGNITTKPLPVHTLNATSNEMGEIMLTWAISNTSHQDYFKVIVQEMDNFNGDGDVLTVRGTNFRFRKLFGGRNYSLSVSSVSNGVESDPSTIFQVTKPAPPLIRGLDPIPNGLNVSWKSDVTSLQDSYAVVVIRNDTNDSVQYITKEYYVLLHNLYPGAMFTFKVYAISNGLWSEPNIVQETMYPNPPRNLTVGSVTNSSMTLHWLAPENSLFGHYIIHYRKSDSEDWRIIDHVKDRSVELVDLEPGVLYVVTVRTVSFRVQSAKFEEIGHILRPSSLVNVDVTLDSQNVTFEWTVPSGKISHYMIVYHSVSKPESSFTRRIPNNATVGEKMAVVVIDLVPGALYHYEFYTVSFDTQSEPYILEIRTMPVINSDIYVVNNPQDTQSLAIRYTPTPNTAANFDFYRFQISDALVPIQEKSVNDSYRLLVFHKLVPGRLYNITVWTVSGGIASMPLYRQDRLFPDPVSDINATHVGDTDITLVWNEPPGDHDAYEVQYLNSDNRLILNLSYTEMIMFTNLQPHRDYTFTVTVRSGTEAFIMKRSVPYSETFSTKESVPGRVHAFKASEVRPGKIVLAWTLPQSEQHGVLVGFTISYRIKGSDSHFEQDFEAHETGGIISDLRAGHVYVFDIYARTKIGSGPVTQLEEAIPVWAPPTPSPLVFPTEVSRSPNTICVRFRKDFFSDSNGPVRKYTIVVTEDVDKDSNGLELPSWKEVQDYKKWPPYQAVRPYYPFNNSLVEDFVVGAEMCQPDKDYCNGPLKPGASYLVKVRAFTAHDKFTDTMFSSPIQTDLDRSSTSAVIAGVAVPIVLIVIVIAVIVVLRKKRLGPFIKKTSHARGKEDNLSIPDSIIDMSRPVKLKAFIEHYRMMSADSDFRFSEEYEELKHIGRDQPCSAADIPVNRPKNRFTNILPYDHSRVKLLPTDDEEGTDYINANYMPGFNSPREFIVTQGPLHSTRDDFWRMVWEQNSRAIVILTRCIEKGREKCDHYWPYDTQPAFYGDIQVTILNESQYSDWTVSEFKVCRGDHSRIVKHFHFTTWPDFGVPDPPQTLICFVRTFRERVGTEQRPIVVHCSAGVGRSGTFIALDRILQHIEKYDYVDLFGIVYEMRKERVWMVQTEQQYICVHQCLVCILEGKESDNLPREIHDNEGFEDDEGIAESGM